MAASRIAVPAGLRYLVIVAGVAAVVLGACGITARVLFTETSQIKYWVSVGAPLAAVFVALAGDPLRVLFALAVVIAPFTVVTTIGGVALSPLLVVLAAALIAAALCVQPAPRRSATGLGVLGAVALLAGPIAIGVQPASHALWLGTLVACGWLAFRVAEDWAGLRFVLHVLVAAASVQAALAIWGFKTGQRLDLYNASGASTLSSQDFFSYERATRPSGAMPDPISLGNVLALACPLALALANEARSRLAAFTLVGAGALIAFGVALTLSRMSWIGAAVGVAVTLILLPPRPRLRSVIAVVGVLAVVVQGAVVFGGAALDERFASIEAPTSRVNPTAGGDKVRLELWHAALQVADDHPVFGSGYGKLVPELAKHTGGVAPGGHAHSVYLQLLAEAGIAGALGLLLVLGGALRDLGRGLRRDRDGDPRLLLAGMAGSMACLVVVWLTDYNVRYTEVGAIVAVLFGAVAAQSTLGRAGS